MQLLQNRIMALYSFSYEQNNNNLYLNLQRIKKVLYKNFQYPKFNLLMKVGKEF